MKNIFKILAVITVISISTSCSKQETFEERLENISKTEMQSVFELLGNDLYEGRAPGTRGGDLAEIYVNSLYKFMDLDPGMGDSYYQPFVMKGFTTQNLDVNIGGESLEYINEVVGGLTIEKKSIDIESEAVFVGFGIKTDSWDWDDYKDADIKDKIVICRVNDPGMYHPEIFEGKILTYYGRWTYHIDEAARRGAAGILLVHTDESAGYGWNVVRVGWTGENLFIKSQLENNMQFRGWVKEESLRALLAKKNVNLDELYETSLSKEFKPIDLGFPIHIKGENSYRDVNNKNVIAEIPGKVKERIVISAHIDHLGIDGEDIYNGTIDNGTAVASMMLVAKILKEHQDELYYSVSFLACNAEESGLLGSKYYVQNTDRSSIIANINLESTPVWAESKSLMGIGARHSGFEDIIKEIAFRDGLEYSQFSLSNQGLFYRSDQFPFAKYGIPAVWISAGEDEVNGEINYTEFWGKDYHTVRDDYNPEWELAGMKQTIKYALLLVDHINKTKRAPVWKDNLPFPMEK